MAKLFVDTGQVCGIINNDTAAQTAVNAYFEESCPGGSRAPAWQIRV